MNIRNKSKEGPLQDADVAQAAADMLRTAHAVGLIDEAPDFADLTYPAVRQAASRVREAGIGERAAADVARGAFDPPYIAGRLREIVSLLEESPLPSTEWARVLDVLESDRLASLVGISPVSLARYAKGERRTPDEVAARLHFLALVVGDLAGAYNDIGIRRWFDRTRAALAGRSPSRVLRGEWRPEDEGPRSVRQLARSLVGSPAT